MRIYRIITFQSDDKEFYNEGKAKIYFIIVPMLVLICGLVVALLRPNSVIVALGIGYSLPAGSWHIFDLIKRMGSPSPISKIEEIDSNQSQKALQKTPLFSILKKYLTS